jgi:hypothetical protein
MSCLIVNGGLDMMVHTCNSSYPEGRGRRAAVPGQLGSQVSARTYLEGRKRAGEGGLEV